MKNKFSGWKVFAGCFLLSFFITGNLSNCLSLYMNPICTSLGLDPASYSITTLVGTLISAIAVMVWAPKMQKGNMKFLMLLAVLFCAIGFVIYSFSKNLIMLIIAALITNIGIAGCTQMPIALLMTMWFNKNRSTIMSFAYAGAGLGGTLFPQVISRMIGSTGWQNTMLIMGLIGGAVGILVCLVLIRKCPQEIGETPYEGNPDAKEKEVSEKKKARIAENNAIASWPGVDRKHATSSGAFWMLVLCMFCIGLMSAGVTTHVPNYLASIGWNATRAASVVSVFSLSCVFGTVIGGVMFDVTGPVKGILFASACATIAMIALCLSGMSTVLAFLFAILLGLAMCMPRMVPAILVSRCFGLKGYATVYGLINVFFLVGCALGSVVTGIFANSIGYKSAWIFYAVICVLVFVFAALAVRSSEKLRTLYPQGSPEAEVKNN